MAAACANASGGSVLKRNLGFLAPEAANAREAAISCDARKLAPTHASTTLPLLFLLLTPECSTSFLNAGTRGKTCSHRALALSSSIVPRNQSMRASSAHVPLLSPQVPSTKTLSNFDSHTIRQRLSTKNDHNASLSAPSAYTVSRLGLLCISEACAHAVLETKRLVRQMATSNNVKTSKMSRQKLSCRVGMH